VISGLAHVQLAAPPGCEGAARRFFGELLGLEEVAKPPLLAGRGGVWFRLGAQQLHVGVEPDFQPARKAHPAFATEELDDLAGRLEDAGAEPAWVDDIPGIRHFYVHDPWGNRLEFVTAVNRREDVPT